MSLSLKLHPSMPGALGRTFDEHDFPWQFAATGSLVVNDSRIVYQIRRLWQKAQLLPDTVQFWRNDEEKGEQRETEDNYGDKLRFVTAQSILSGVTLPTPCNAWDTGVFKFLACLPAETPVVLWWS